MLTAGPVTKSLGKEAGVLSTNSRRVTSLAPDKSVTKTGPGLLGTRDRVTLKRGRNIKSKPVLQTPEKRELTVQTCMAGKWK